MKEPKQRSDRQYRGVVRKGWLQRQRSAKEVQQRSCQIDDRPASGHDHDHEDEGGFREAAAFEVVQCMACAALRHQKQQQDHGPKAEDDFDFTQEMPQAGVRRLDMRKMLKIARAERMDDLIKIELYAVLASACVLAVAQVDRALVGALAATQFLEQSDKTRSILLRELAHRVANNFAVVATLIRTKAASVSDPQAKLVLNEAIEQVTVMARLHRLLHADDQVPTIDSERFIAELCQDLETSMACARPISIQSVAVSRQLPVAQAVPMGLIVNELITNAIKHAFPGGRSGTVCVSLGEEDEHRLRLTIEDDGVGFRQPKSSGMGQRLVAALAEQLGGRFESKVTAYGCSFSVAFPYADPPPTTRPSLSEQMAH